MTTVLTNSRGTKSASTQEGCYSHGRLTSMAFAVFNARFGGRSSGRRGGTALAVLFCDRFGVRLDLDLLYVGSWGVRRRYLHGGAARGMHVLLHVRRRLGRVGSEGLQGTTAHSGWTYIK